MNDYVQEIIEAATKANIKTEAAFDAFTIQDRNAGYKVEVAAAKRLYFMKPVR